MRKFLSLCFIMLGFVLQACKQEQPSRGATTLSVNPDSIEAPGAKSTQSIQVTSNGYWEISIKDEDGTTATWITTDSERGQGNQEVLFKFQANLKDQPRTAFIYISSPASKDLVCKVTVIQAKGEISEQGYEFPICQTFDIESPDNRQFSNGVVATHICQFFDGMSISFERDTMYFKCPAHTEPADSRGGSESLRSIWAGVRMGKEKATEKQSQFKKGDHFEICIPVKNALYGDLRLMLGARAAKFTTDKLWTYEWSSDKQNWHDLGITKAETPGSDAVWNVFKFNISEAEKIPAQGKIHFRFTLNGDNGNTYVVISNSICLCNDKAEASKIPAMDNDKQAFSHGFDDVIGSNGAHVEYPIGLMRSATTGFSKGKGECTNAYSLPNALSAYAKATCCFSRPGYLQVGYYDESLWARQDIGSYTVKIGERLKNMGISSADAKLKFKAARFKDARGYESVANVYAKCGTDSSSFSVTLEEFKDYEVEFKKINSNSEIIISCPELTENQIAALARGEKSKYLLDYRFYIDDVQVILTEIHSQGASAEGSYPDFNDGGQYKW